MVANDVTPRADSQLPRLPPHVERSQTESSVTTTSGSVTGPGQTNGSTPAPQQIPADMYVPPGLPASSGATFGVDLGEQLARDGREIPKVVEKCAQAIEAYGELGRIMFDVTLTAQDWNRWVFTDYQAPPLECKLSKRRWTEVSGEQHCLGNFVLTGRCRRSGYHVRRVVSGYQRRFGRFKALVQRIARTAVDVWTVSSVHRGCS